VFASERQVDDCKQNYQEKMPQEGKKRDFRALWESKAGILTQKHILRD